MTVKDICDTRFEEDLRCVVKKSTGNKRRGIFGWSEDYNELYDGQCMNMPKELYDLKVDHLKIIDYKFVIAFCKK